MYKIFYQEGRCLMTPLFLPTLAEKKKEMYNCPIIPTFDGAKPTFVGSIFNF